MEEIRNPLSRNIMLTYAAALAGLLVIFAPRVVESWQLYQFYFAYFGVVIIIFAVGFFIFYTKRSQAFKVFLTRKEESLYWEYEEEQYLEFIGELNKLQRTANVKKIWMLLAIIVVISILLFFLLSEGMKWLSIVFFVFFSVSSLLFTIIFPQSFKYQALVKPYVTIINSDEAYIMGRFHKWTKAKASIKNYDNGTNVYKVLAINYEALTRNGRMYQEWTAVIPDPKDPEMLAEAKKWVKRINKQSRDREKEKSEKKSWLETQFRKVFSKNKSEN